MPGLHAAAGEEHGHGFGVVAAAERIDAAALVVVGRAAEFAAPDDERVVEHAALLEVADERGDRLVHAADALGVGALEVVVAVPAAAEDLHEAHAFLHEPAREQALAAKGRGVLVVQPIHLAGGVGLALEVEHVGHFHLHAKGEFVGVHARGEFLVLGMLRGVLRIEERELVEEAALMLARLEAAAS